MSCLIAGSIRTLAPDITADIYKLFAAESHKKMKPAVENLLALMVNRFERTAQDLEQPLLNQQVGTLSVTLSLARDRAYSLPQPEPENIISTNGHIQVRTLQQALIDNFLDRLYSPTGGGGAGPTPPSSRLAASTGRPPAAPLGCSSRSRSASAAADGAMASIQSWLGSGPQPLRVRNATARSAHARAASANDT